MDNRQKQRIFREFLQINESQEPSLQRLRQVIHQKKNQLPGSKSSVNIDIPSEITLEDKKVLVKLFSNILKNPEDAKFYIIKTTNERLKTLFVHKWVHDFISQLGFVFIKPYYFIDHLSETMKKNLTKSIELLNETQVILRQTSLPQQIIDPYGSIIDIIIGPNKIKCKSIIDSGNEGPVCMSREFYDKIVSLFVNHLVPIPIDPEVIPVLQRIFQRIGIIYRHEYNLHETYMILKQHESDIKSLLRTREFYFPIQKFYEIIGCKFITGVNGSLDEPLTEKINLKFSVNHKEIDIDVFILPNGRKSSSFDILFNVEFMHKMKEKKILPSYLPMYNMEFFEAIESIKNKVRIEMLKSDILVSKKGQNRQILNHQFQINKLNSQLIEISDTLQQMSSLLVDDENAKSMIFIDPYKIKVLYKINSREKILETIFDTGNQADNIITLAAVQSLIWDGTGLPPSRFPFDNNALPSEIQNFNFILENIQEPPIRDLPITYQMIYHHLESHREKIQNLFDNQEEKIKLVYTLCGLKYVVGVEDVTELIIPNYVNLELKIPHIIDSLPIRALVKDLPGSTEVLINIDTIRELVRQNIHLSFDTTSRRLNSLYARYFQKKRSKNINLLMKIIDQTVTRYDIQELEQESPSQIHQLQQILKKPSKNRRDN